MQTCYLIPVHSFVDLITNSSSEIFVSADQKTLDGIRDIINNILIAGGSEVRADQMFEFELVNDEDGYGSQSVKLTPKIPDSPEIVTLAKRLSNLTGMFEINAEYNG